MSLSSLPWFIRREIIDLAIANNPKLCSVNKEWLKQVAMQHGALSFDEQFPPATHSNSLFTPHVKTIQFYRISNIDWDVVHQYKNVKVVIISSYWKYEPSHFESFTEKLLELPFLNSFRMSIGDFTFDLIPILKRNQFHLKDLCLGAEDISWYPLDMIFPNLNSLYLMGIKQPFIVQNIVNCMPKLKNLKLVDSNIIFNKDKILGVLELKISTVCSIPPYTLDISLFPNLIKLNSGDLDLTETNPNSNNIEELLIKKFEIYSSCYKKCSFTKLKKLTVTFFGNNINNNLDNLFQFFTKLPTLNLDYEGKCRSSIKFPVGLFSITDLTLSNFLFSSSLLRWLSTSFKLKKLLLSDCQIRKSMQLKPVPFKSLEYLKIISDFKSFGLFKEYFKTNVYPNTNIEITERSIDQEYY